MMDEKPLITPGDDIEAKEDDRYEEGRKRGKRDRSGVTLKTGLRASKRSMRNFTNLDQQTPQRTNKSKPLINTRALRYNPAGPGDYNLPSAFGELPPVKAPHETRSSFYKNRKQSVAVKANPSFSIGGRIDNN